MKDKPCTTPFDEIRHLLAPPEPQSVGIKMVLNAASKLAAYEKAQFHNRTQDLLAECNQRYRDSIISITNDIYSRIPQDSRM